MNNNIEKIVIPIVAILVFIIIAIWTYRYFIKPHNDSNKFYSSAAFNIATKPYSTSTGGGKRRCKK
jgi:hypothetical protein